MQLPLRSAVFWSTLLIIDSSLKESVQYTKKNVEECAVHESLLL